MNDTFDDILIGKIYGDMWDSEEQHCVAEMVCFVLGHVYKHL